jgi:arylsulfatase A-like enzyme
MEPGEFQGTIGRYYWDSKPWWPERPKPKDGAPNVLMVVLDDVGFAQIGCFGSDIDTPVLDGLAKNGLRYTNFHTTALCSPTRACLMTGRNHHSVGMGRVIELATGFPGYDATISKANGFLSEMLVPHGYAAYAVGKWHLTPHTESHNAAPRGRWPLGRGFERYYGFFDGQTHQYVPALIEDNHQVDPPRSIAEGYHLTEDLVDHGIEYLKDLRAIDPGKPFFMYLAPAACHAPHQAPAEWIERYRGRFDAGWDVARTETFARQIRDGVLPPQTQLSARPDWVPAWEELSADERRLYARYMEAFAGFLEHTDHHLGRLLEFLRETGDLDNTLVFVLSDNGASSEGGPFGTTNDLRLWNFFGESSVPQALERLDDIGGPKFFTNYPWGWTVAGNTPFRRWKREVHEGGVCDPLIVHWPRGIVARGEVRRQYVHAIDLLPSVLELAGVSAPESIDGVSQRPIEGVSFAQTFDDAGAASRRETQYFEMFGCRALYHQGWKAVVYHTIQDPNERLTDDGWELYDTEQDPSECNDLALSEPDRLREMIELWWSEASRYGVLPLDNRAFSDLTFRRPRGAPALGRYVYYPDAAMVPEDVAVNVRNRSHSITAEVSLPSAGVEGVLIAQGSLLGGWSLYMKDGRLHYVHNFLGIDETRISSDASLGPGEHALGFRFDKTGEHRGTGTLLVDGVAVGSIEIARFTPVRFSVSGAGLTCGLSGGLPVTEDYEPPFRFTGRIRRVVVDVDGAAFADAQAEAAIAVRTQ